MPLSHSMDGARLRTVITSATMCKNTRNLSYTCFITLEFTLDPQENIISSRLTVLIRAKSFPIPCTNICSNLSEFTLAYSHGRRNLSLIL